jgi:hypothetical protein
MHVHVKKLVVPVAAAAVVGALVVAPSAAGAVTFRHMLGFAGGTAVQALGTTVESDLTSESSVDTVTPGAGETNTALTASVPSVATVGAVNTGANSDALDDGGVQVVTSAQTAGVNLLGGAIQARAVTTTDVATVHGNNTTDYSVHTEFVGLKISGLTIPLTVPKNFHLTIPNVANVVLNASFASAGPAGSGALMTEGAGVYISLLKARGDNPAGTVIFVNPTYSAISTVSPTNTPTIGGYAYGSKITAKAGNLLNAESGPTARISLPINGTGGVVKHNTTATVSIPSVLTASAVTDYAQGVKAATGSRSYSTMTTQLANVNLLGGLITADALTGIAHVETTPGGGTTSTATTSFVNLSIAGRKIPVTISPNTVINLANVGTVTVREQSKNDSQAQVTLLDIKISTASYGLPAGAEVRVGVAAAWVIVPS